MTGHLLPERHGLFRVSLTMSSPLTSGNPGKPDMVLFAFFSRFSLLVFRGVVSGANGEKLV